MATKSYQCFICCGVIAKTDKDDNLLNEPITHEEDSSPQLSKNLEVVFILRNLLQVPCIHLENNLRKCGSDPGSWIRLCDQCTQLTRNARQLDGKIRKLEKQLRCVRKEVVEKISGRCSKVEDDDKYKVAYLNGNGLGFEEKIRSFVKTHDYTDMLAVKQEDDPCGFLEGDRLANYLAGEQSCNVLLIEKDVEEDEIKIEVESPPSSPPPPPTPPSPLGNEEDFSRESSGDVEDEDYTIKAKAKRKTKLKGSRLRKKIKRRGNSKNSLICNYCGMEMESLEMLKKHKNKHYNKNRKGEPKGPWICDICGLEAKGYSALQRHRRKVHKVNMKGEPLKELKKEDKKVLCNLCGMELCDKQSLEMHVKVVHDKQFGYSCHVCGLGLRGKRDLHKHLLRMHGEDEETRRLGEEEGLKLIRCGVRGCGGVFLREEEMGKHRERYHGEGGEGEGRWKCEVCGKGFWIRATLRKHERVHERK